MLKLHCFCLDKNENLGEAINDIELDFEEQYDFVLDDDDINKFVSVAVQEQYVGTMCGRRLEAVRR